MKELTQDQVAKKAQRAHDALGANTLFILPDGSIFKQDNLKDAIRQAGDRFGGKIWCSLQGEEPELIKTSDPRLSILTGGQSVKIVKAESTTRKNGIAVLFARLSLLFTLLRQKSNDPQVIDGIDEIEGQMEDFATDMDIPFTPSVAPETAPVLHKQGGDENQTEADQPDQLKEEGSPQTAADTPAHDDQVQDLLRKHIEKLKKDLNAAPKAKKPELKSLLDEAQQKLAEMQKAAQPQDK